MNLKDQAAAALKAAQDIVESVKAGESMTEEQRTQVKAHLDEHDRLTGRAESTPLRVSDTQRLAALTT